MHVICFSHRRQLQLHGYLGSLFHNLRPHRVTVIYPDQDYSEVKKCFPSVEFAVENPDFSITLHRAVERVKDPTIAFGCDDMIFTRSLWGQLPVLGNPRVLGYSLRLHDGLSGAPNGRVWEWPKEKFASYWGYPFDLTGTIYRTETIRNMLANLGEIKSPNLFESKGTAFMKRYLAGHYLLLERNEFPSCIIQQVNTVQTVIALPEGSVDEHRPEELDELYKDGKRLDWRCAAGAVPREVWSSSHWKVA